MAMKKAAAKAAPKGTKRKYSPAASKQVETEMREMKQGTLKSGNSNEKVTNPKQAIAIALSEARRAGKKVPPSPEKASSVKKSTPKKETTKKAGQETARKSSSKKKSAAR